VAVAFDDRKDTLIQTAVSLAKRCGLALKLIHGVEPPTYDSLAVETPTVVSIPTALVEDMARQLRERRMEMTALVERLRKSHIDITGEVIEGDAVRTVISAAVNARANLIITACHPPGNRFLPVGFSTALSLMHEAPLPVLVVGRRPTDWEKASLRFLIADDLQTSTREATLKGFEMAALFPKSHIRHVHVHGDFREALTDTWRDIKDKIPGLKTENVTPETIWRDEYEARLHALTRQSLPFRRLAEKADVFIEPDIRTGKVQEEIHNVIQEFDPDLCVFGRHRLVRTKPFLIGRMPLRTMIEEERAILVVPPKEDLYAALPFPAALQ
jgi:nucleotide-binding universal stress UspA family protein